MTVVLHKGNAIIYAGFAQIKKSGARELREKAEQLLQQALSRLDT